jgi:hypothetical protein
MKDKIKDLYEQIEEIKKLMWLLDGRLKKIHLIQHIFSETKYTLNDFITLITESDMCIRLCRDEGLYLKANNITLFYERKDLCDTIENFINKSSINLVCVSAILRFFALNMFKNDLFNIKSHEYYLTCQLERNLDTTTLNLFTYE